MRPASTNSKPEGYPAEYTSGTLGQDYAETQRILRDLIDLFETGGQPDEAAAYRAWLGRIRRRERWALAKRACKENPAGR